MPKVSTDTAEAPKKVPRKRAVRRTIDAAPTALRRTRTVSQKEPGEIPTALRKAPTRLSETGGAATHSKKWPKVLGAFLLVVGAAAWIGFSDKGQIDVSTRINEANQNTAAETTPDNNSVETVVPVQNTPPAAISGIRPRDPGDVPDPELVAETPTEASSTEPQSDEEGSAEETTEAAPPETAPEDSSAATTEAGTPELAP